MTEAIRIIGIDPGLRNTGWGVIDSLGNSLRFVASGTVKSDNKLDLASRLNQLYDGLETVLHEFQPFEAAVENTFVNKDATATLKLGQARGIAMLAPARAGLRVAGVCAKRGQESGDRGGTWRQEADPDDGQDADPEGKFRQRSRRRRSGDCNLSCASPHITGVADGGGIGTVQ
jgi:hypothetical protein